MFTREKQEMKRVPMMPVRDMVIFPQQMTPFIVGREASVRALEEALAGDKKIFLSTQHDASVDDPKPEEIYAVGTLANIVQSVKLPDGNIKVLVEGIERARAVSISPEEGFFRATIRLMAKAGARRVRLLESPMATAEPLEEFMLASGWEPRAFENLGTMVEFENTNYLGYGKKYSRFMVPGGGLMYKGYDLNHSYEDCDVFVSLAKLKEHVTAGVTVTLVTSVVTKR